jgi:hypothetical protein
VAKEDVSSFKNKNHWLENHPVDALMFKDLETVWPQLATVYNGSFKNLVFGELPKDTDVYKTLTRIKERLSAIEWTIKL